MSCIFVRSARALEWLEKLQQSGFALFETQYEKATCNNMSSLKNKGEKYETLKQKFAEIYQKEGLVKACKKTETFSVKLKRMLPKGMRAFAKKVYHKLHDKKIK